MDSRQGFKLRYPLALWNASLALFSRIFNFDWQNSHLPKAQRTHCLNEASFSFAVLKKNPENVLLLLVVVFLIFLWCEFMKLTHRIQYSNLLHFRHCRIHPNFSRIEGSPQTRFDPFALSRVLMQCGLIFYEWNTNIFNKTFPRIFLTCSCLKHCFISFVS